MKLHLPLSLLTALLSSYCLATTIVYAEGEPLVLESGQALNLSGSTAGLQAPLILSDGILSIDYSSATAPVSLNGHALSLSGGTALHLIPGTATDGRVIKLLTNVGPLYGADGTPLVLSAQNNASANYFDITQPGTGFWAGATLQLTSDGTLQLVRHSEEMKEAVEFTTRYVSDNLDYRYYEGVTFRDSAHSGRDAVGGAIDGGWYSTITLSDNGSVSFSENSVTASGDDAEAFGGAIYGYSSTITLSDNGSVSFDGNSATSSGDRVCAYGGAIYGSTITLSNNGSVSFSGNSVTASGSGAEAYASGGAIYGGNTITLSGNGSVTFDGNSAASSGYHAFGGAICGSAEGCTITLSKNGSVSFSGNSVTASGDHADAYAYGGAIDGDRYSTITLSNNGIVSFSGNSASGSGAVVFASGGAIYGDSLSTITLSNNGSVSFSGNSVSCRYAFGGAIYGSTITLSNNGIVSFSGNSASGDDAPASGGAIYGGNTITLSDNGSVSFSGNSASGDDASASGGAIHGSTITLSDNGSVTFSGNSVSSSSSYYYSYGGAIDGDTITLSNNGSVSFDGNSASGSGADAFGGAIYGDWYSTITLSNNGSVSFSGNSASGSGADAYASGGAIYGDRCTITLSNNGIVSFSGNSASGDDASASGGAIHGSTITLSDNGSVSFVGNSAVASGDYASGGAIHGSTITLSDNVSVSFSGNSASGYNASGGAIYGDSQSTITLSNNGSVSFDGNSASGDYANAYGGAIHGSTITLSDNGSVSFSGNSASGYNADGGAIKGSAITLSNNGSVSFSGNTATASGYDASGGAIYTTRDLNIRNNGTVLFEKNAEIEGDTYRLRSIYAGGDGVISLSAAEGKKIEFRDSVYIDSDYTIKLNEDYTDAAGKVHKQGGDIIFTGAYTEKHLNELLTAAGAGRTATAAEIAGSRTSKIYRDVTLYGGRLRVEDGAVFSGYGLSTIENSSAIVQMQNATINCSGYDINISKGTALHLSGANSISGNLHFASGSSLVLTLSSVNNTVGSPKALLTLSGGTMNMANGATIHISMSDGLSDEGEYLLFANVASYPDWMNNWSSFLDEESDDSGSVYYDVEARAVYLSYDVHIFRKGTWKNYSGNCRWDKDSINWLNGSWCDRYSDGAELVFGNDGAGAVQLVGSLAPHSVTVANYAGYDYTWHGQGRLVGSMSLTKKGHGSLTINTANTYTGGTNIYAGTVKTGTATALGTGKVNLYGGTLHLNKQAVANTITLSGSATIYGSSFKGNFSMSSGTLSADSYLGIISGKTATIKGGTIKGTITGAGSTAIAGKVNLTDGAITTNKLTIYSGNKLSVTTTKGLNGRAIQMGTGGQLSSVGQVAATSLTMSGGSSLLVKGAYPRSVAIAGATNLTNSTAEIHGSLSGGSVSLTGSSLKQVGGPIGVKLSGKFALDNASSAAIGGSITASNLSVKNNSALSINGDYAREVNLADTAYIASAGMNLNGYLVAKNLTLNKGRLYQHHSAKGIKVTNKLTMGSGSTLSTGAALNLNSATISGGTINMTSSTIQRINVTYTFNLTGAMDLNLGCNLTKGSTYKLITYGKTNLTSSSNLTKLLGMTGAGCKLIFNPKYIAIQVTDSTAWSKYIAANKTAFSNAYTAVTDGVVPTDLDDGDEPGALPAYDGGEAFGTDLTLHTALVQSSWGTVHASRAFVDALSNRMQNATTLGESKATAAWLSVLGGAGRISWDGAYAGSDYHLTGAAFGMQQQLTTRSSMGLAIGNSWGKVSSFGAPSIDQDTTHIALYGDSTLLQREKDALTLSWSAAYGRTNSDMTLDGIHSEWEQKAIQLNARATYGYALSERTTLSGFAGLEYLATDSGDIAPGAANGSVQNLRGELGVSLGHKFSDRSSMYAELSFVGDMVRHNPTAEFDVLRSKGSNPGRAGINFSVGGSHALNENWSVNAAYNLELMQHANSHSANIGFSRKF